VMNKEVLETSTFPDVVFESLEVRADRQKDDLYKLSVQGPTLHGVVNDHAFTPRWLSGQTVRGHMANSKCDRRITPFELRLSRAAH
jgi:hypothetical protein